MNLAERFSATLAQAISQLDDAPALDGMRARLAERAAAMDARIRVAVVGRVSEGKSTLVNALVGKALTPTGAMELSYSVNHLRYGFPVSLTVHCKNGNSFPASIEQLSRYAARREDNRDLLASIEYLEVVSDQPYLAGFDLIDTAGLDSIYGDDSEGTLAFLRRSRAEIRKAAAAATTEADALIVVMSARGMARTDEELLHAFLGPESAFRSPVTTTAVMTKVEHLWPGTAEPMAAAHGYVGTMMLKSSLRRLLFRIEPVCSLLAASAAGLDEGDLADLKDLSAVQADKLAASLRDARIFARADRGLPLAPSRRTGLRDRFTGYGLLVACNLLRDGVDSVQVLREQLDLHSGMATLRTQLTGHFSERADLLKVRSTIDLVARIGNRLRRDLDPPSARLLNSIVALVENFRDEPGLRELDLLQRIAAGQLRLSAEDHDDVMHAIGEYGGSVYDRLSLPRETGLSELRNRASVMAARWGMRSAIGDRYSAFVVHSRYQNLLYHIDKARRHLESPD